MVSTEFIIDVLRGNLVTFEIDHGDAGHLEPATRRLAPSV